MLSTGVLSRKGFLPLLFLFTCSRDFHPVRYRRLCRREVSLPHTSQHTFFEAHEDIHDTLILSENPAHCVWESTAQRLIKNSGKEGCERIDKLHTLLKNTFIDFSIHRPLIF